MNALVVGASAGLGRALAEAIARRGSDLILVATDGRDLDVQAADLQVRHGVVARTVACDLSPPVRCVDAIADVANDLRPLDALLFPVGLALDEDRGLLDAASTQRLLDVNFGAVVATVSRFLPDLVERGGGAIVGFGSVAAIRGRSRNVVYAASKRALQSYFESLRHLTAGTGVEVSFYELGYLDTQAAWGRRLAVPAAQPAAIAEDVVARLHERGKHGYLPRYWRPLGWLVRAIPEPIFRRLDF